MVARKDLVEEFATLGVTVQDQILDKCLELCQAYQRDAETFVEDWMAFGLSVLQSAVPSLEGLVLMERKEYEKAEKEESKKANVTEEIKVYTAAAIEEMEDSLMDAYANCTTPKSAKVSKGRFSPNSASKVHGNLSFSPATYRESAATSSVTYAERTDAGTVVCSFGPKSLLESATFKLPLSTTSQYTVKLHGDPQNHLKINAKYMYDTISSKANMLNACAEWIGSELLKKHSLSLVQSISNYSVGSYISYGRIMSENELHLNSASVLMETTLEYGGGTVVPVNLTKLEKYSVFPGQVVAVDASSVNGTLAVNKIFCDASLQLSAEPLKLNPNEPLQLVVACGPYTIPHNLLYQPFDDFIKYLSERNPHVVIMMGPFVDSVNENISDGTLAETYNAHFEKLIVGLMTSLKNTTTQVVLMPSLRDAHHHYVYPTPPYVLRKQYPNLHLFPDPAVININDLIIGISSADILFHMVKEELSWPRDRADRMARFAEHVITQQNFYPLFPPDESMPIDYSLFEQHCFFSVTPHILVLPSALRYFVKKVKDCIVINPEKMVKGNIGGTFARIEVHQCDEPARVHENIATEIVRI